MGKQLIIGFLTDTDPMDKRSWSGIHYRMVKSIEEQGFSVVCLGPPRLDKYSNYALIKLLWIFKKIHDFLFRKGRYNTSHSHLVSYFQAQYFNKKICENDIDVIFAPAASNQIAHIKTKIPICYYSDATVAVLFDLYDFSGFSSFSIKESNQIEQRAIQKSKTQVFSSKWAFDSAKFDYNATNPFIVKMGANIDVDPPQENITQKTYEPVLKLLFIGVDWKRKGGEIVLETLNKLDEKGYDVHLTVVGCIPPKENPKMTVIPNLNKNIKEEMLVFEDLLKASHLLFLPTRAECYGIAFCEANAFGLPVISTNTGGVSSVIEDGVNGFLLPLSATSEDYCMVIENLINDKDKLKKLAKSSREKYDKELNWHQWGKKIKEILLLTRVLCQAG